VSIELSLAPLVYVRERGDGACYAFPLADPRKLSRGESVEEALAEQEHYLERYLSKCPASELADFIYPPEAELIDIRAVLPRADLPRRLQIEAEVVVPCVVVPDGRAHWVHVLPMGHTIYVRREEDLTRRVGQEVVRAAAARSLTGEEYLRVLPAPAHRVVRLAVEIERDDASDATKRAATRRRDQTSKKDKAARTLLAKVGTELLSTAKDRKRVAPVLGRDREIRTLGSLLSGRERLGVVLVGEPGCGKTAVVHGLLAAGPERFSGSVYATSGAQLVAGQSGFGQLPERVDAVMAAAARTDSVLYFDDYGDLFAGHSGSIEDLAAMMRPWLADGRVRIVGELSPEVLEHHEKRHVAFFAAMHRISVDVAEPSLTRAIVDARIVHQRRTEPHRPQLDAACIEPLVELSERYLTYQAFPGKAVALADELRAVHEGEVGEDGSPRAIEVADVYKAFSVRSGIPMFLLRQTHAMRYTEVLEFFTRAVIGQRPAIEAVAQTLCTVKAELQPPSKPLANLLFVGPTGVGKTEVAKTLARFLFGGTDKLVRFDMSEYADAYASERLIRGTERDEGELTRKVRQQPFCVVLLDEIEKAHPAVFDLLLALLGEGRLSDARGKTTNFCNCIVIMTSNLGAAHRRPASGFGAAAQPPADLQSYYLEQVDRHFRPEFVNRLDRVIAFAPLSTEDIARVAKVALKGLVARDGLEGRGIELTVSDRALAELAAAGHSDAYGARALRRHLEDHLVAPVGRILAEAGGDAEAGAVRVVLADHETPDAAGEVNGRRTIAQRTEGPLLITLVGMLGAGGHRGGAQELGVVARLRRTATACRGLEVVTELRDRAETLVAELARAAAKGRHNVNAAAAAAEHARLHEGLTALDDAVELLEGVEDLARAAVSEGEPVDGFVTEAEHALASFERVFVRVVLGQHEMNEVLLIVRAHADQPRLVAWLTGLLGIADERGWRVLVHRWEDKKPAPPWPESLPWGPPRDAAWLKESFEQSNPKEIGRAYRAAIVRVSGPLAGALMCLEAGLQRFTNVPDLGRPAHLHIALLRLSFAIENEKLAGEAYDAGKPRDPKVQARAPVVREFDLEHGTTHARGQLFRVPVDDYWAAADRIAFSVLVARLIAGDDPFGDEALTEEAGRSEASKQGDSWS